ncbi:MAG TPA: hypothetical protein VH723_00425 [Candidatus Limnocylindrales bacterium]
MRGTRPSARVAAMAVLAVGVAAIVAAALSASRPAGTPGLVVSDPAVELRYGIRLSQVAVIADGGLVDVRFVVLDPALAADLTASEATIPTLVVEGSGTRVRSAALMGAKHDLRAGRTSFLLYRNTGGVIKHGTLVTIDFGDLRIEHVVAG